jgi:zinc transporter ZupT
LYTAGIFDLSLLDEEVRATCTTKKHYFWFGEVTSAAVLALVFCVPLGIFLSQGTDITLAFIGAAMLFLPLFVFLPRIIRQGMRADTEAIFETFGKNEQVKKIFWTVFAAITGLVLARVVDPVFAQQVAGMIVGMGM